MQAMTPAVELHEEHGGPVRIPVGDFGEVAPGQLQVHEDPGSWAPDRRRSLAPPLVADGQAIVTGDRRPGERDELAPLVEEVRDHRARPGVEHAKRRVDEVTVLPVLDRDERLVGVQGRHIRSTADHRVAAAEED